MNIVGMVQMEQNGKWKFNVWAPLKTSMSLHIVRPVNRLHEMYRVEDGSWEVEVDAFNEPIQYFFNPDGDFPDPASCFQPEGVKGPSQTVNHKAFPWTDQHWQPPAIKSFVIYELHLGCFTNEGDFKSAIDKLPELKDLGVSAIELMPVSQFPGERNWGYDSIYPYAVQNSYGGPDGLKKLVDACHNAGIAVILDVIYNHIGPEGNYFEKFGPYFTDKYQTPWGAAINFDDEWSDGVRNFFTDNVLYWFREFHIDGLRCDAVHMMYDSSALHFWPATISKVRSLEKELGKKFYMIAESDLNSPLVTAPLDKGGWGFDAQWLDDFHHGLYAAIDEKGRERYYDFGSIQQVAKSFKEGFIHSGQWVEFRKRLHGRSSAHVPGDEFVSFINNHDQAGNRPGGERLNMLVDFNRAKLAAAALFLSPYIPFLFMGEEYAEDRPFFFFADFSEPELREGVAEGRKKQFEDFPSDQEAPDPLDEQTFNQCKLRWDKKEKPLHKEMYAWYKVLIAMRRKYSALQEFDKEFIQVDIEDDKCLIIRRADRFGSQQLYIFLNLSSECVMIRCADKFNAARLVLSSEERRFQRSASAPADLPREKFFKEEFIKLSPFAVSVYLTINNDYVASDGS